LGLIFGSGNTEVEGIITCWSPTAKVIETAVEKKANVIICHEPLTYDICGKDPEANLVWYEEAQVLAKKPNIKRLKYVFENNLTIYRYHSNWDWAPRFGIADALAEKLELGNNRAGSLRNPVFIIEPTPVKDVISRAREKSDLQQIRVAGDPEKNVERISICQGGFGQMFTYPELPDAEGADLALFGEMLDYTIRYCVEIDLAAVELGHFQSENPGMMAMARFLQERVGNDINISGVSSGEPWRFL